MFVSAVGFTLVSYDGSHDGGFHSRFLGVAVIVDPETLAQTHYLQHDDDIVW